MRTALLTNEQVQSPATRDPPWSRYVAQERVGVPRIYGRHCPAAGPQAISIQPIDLHAWELIHNSTGLLSRSANSGHPKPEVISP